MVKVIYIICGIAVFFAISIGIYIVSDHYASQMEMSLVKEATLRDLKGNSWQVSQLNAKVGVVYFGYTYCPDICPTALNNLSIALKEMGKEGEIFQPIFVSVDPGRDTPFIIDKYISHFGNNFIGLTGTEAELKSFTWVFGATYSLRNLKPNEVNYVVDHTANLFLVTSGGRFFTLPVRDDPDDLRQVLIRAKNSILE